LQAGRPRVRDSLESIIIFSIYLILPAVLGFIQPLTEMSTRSRKIIVLEVQRGRCLRLTTLRHLRADCLDNVGPSTCQPYRPSRPVTRIALLVIIPTMCSPSEQ
jgi:hypothetical protein